jgi:hypothetical protein
VFAPVVDELDSPVGLFDAIAHHAADVRATAAQIAHVDVVKRVAVAVMDVERFPLRRYSWLDLQAIHFQPQSEQGFGHQAVHPPGRAGVPGPSAAADVLRVCVNVGGDDVWLYLVTRDCGFAVSVTNRIDEPE